jgi:transcriptional regulator with XRE-family HTH domain
MSLGQFLKETRIVFVKTQQEMAELIGLSHSYYQRLENNKAERVTRKTLKKIASKTGIHENEIFRAAGIPYAVSRKVVVVPGSIEDYILSIADFFEHDNMHYLSNAIKSCLQEPNAEVFRKVSLEVRASLNPSDLQAQAWILAMDRYQAKLDILPKVKTTKPSQKTVEKTVEFIQLELI